MDEGIKRGVCPIFDEQYQGIRPQGRPEEPLLLQHDGQHSAEWQK